MNHRNARKTAKKAWKNARKLYYEKLREKLKTCDSNPKTNWKLLKAVCGMKINTSMLVLIENGPIYDKNSKKANLLNDFFVCQSTLDINTYPDLPDMAIESNHPKKLLELTVTPNEIYQTLLKSNPNNRS